MRKIITVFSIVLFSVGLFLTTPQPVQACSVCDAVSDFFGGIADAISSAFGGDTGVESSISGDPPTGAGTFFDTGNPAPGHFSDAAAAEAHAMATCGGCTGAMASFAFDASFDSLGWTAVGTYADGSSDPSDPMVIPVDPARVIPRPTHVQVECDIEFSHNPLSYGSSGQVRVVNGVPGIDMTIYHPHQLYSKKNYGTPRYRVLGTGVPVGDWVNADTSNLPESVSYTYRAYGAAGSVVVVCEDVLTIAPPVLDCPTDTAFTMPPVTHSGPAFTNISVKQADGTYVNQNIQYASPRIWNTVQMNFDICSTMPLLNTGDNFFFTIDQFGEPAPGPTHVDWPSYGARYFTFRYVKGVPRHIEYFEGGRKKNAATAVYDGACNVWFQSQYRGRSSKFKNSKVNIERFGEGLCLPPDDPNLPDIRLFTSTYVPGDPDGGRAEGEVLDMTMAYDELIEYFRWETTNAVSCSSFDITGTFNVGGTSGTDNTIASPSAGGIPISYRIECSNAFGTSWREVLIDKRGAPTAPTIMSFYADPYIVSIGSSTRLYWSVDDNGSPLTGCQIGHSNPVGVTGLAGNPAALGVGVTNRVVTTDRETDFTLTCANGVGAASRSLRVDVVPNIMIDSVVANGTLLSAEAGTYQVAVSAPVYGYEVGVPVSGIPSGITLTEDFARWPVLEFTSPYSVAAPGMHPEARNYSATIPSVRFGRYTLELRLDQGSDATPAGSVNPYGLVEEDNPLTAQNEDILGNISTIALVLPPPDPIMTLISDAPNDTVRSGQRATVTAEIRAPYDMTCTLVGPLASGSSESFTHSSSSVTNLSYSTSERRNSGEYRLTCDYNLVGFPPRSFTEILQIDVVPTAEEV